MGTLCVEYPTCIAICGRQVVVLVVAVVQGL